MKKSIAGLGLVALSLLFSSIASAAPVRDLSSRHGDNTIYFDWNSEAGRVEEASSSRMFRAKQRVELLTRLTDRSDEIVMRAIFKNVSQSQKLRVQGILVHKVFQEDVLIKRLESTGYNTVLGPGERIVERFTYTLVSGEYSARTDFERSGT